MKKRKIYWMIGLISLVMLSCEEPKSDASTANLLKPLEIEIHQEEAPLDNEAIIIELANEDVSLEIEGSEDLPPAEMMTNPIFQDEDAMLLALQGSWLWQDAPKKEINDYAWLWNTAAYFEEYSYGFVVRYLLAPTSMFIAKYSHNIMDLDMAKLEIDLASNTLIIGSYYHSHYRLIFHFLNENRVEVSERGLHPGFSMMRMYEGRAVKGYREQEGERDETYEETKARIESEPAIYSMFRFFSKDPEIKIFIFDKMDGFEHDDEYNVYDKEGNFLMNPQMIRENEAHGLPNGFSMQ